MYWWNFIRTWNKTVFAVFTAAWLQNDPKWMFTLFKQCRQELIIIFLSNVSYLCWPENDRSFLPLPCVLLLKMKGLGECGGTTEADCLVVKVGLACQRYHPVITLFIIAIMLCLFSWVLDKKWCSWVIYFLGANLPLKEHIAGHWTMLMITFTDKQVNDYYNSI